MNTDTTRDDPQVVPLKDRGTSTRGKWRRCSSCRGVCRRHREAWICAECGGEWSGDPSPAGPSIASIATAAVYRVGDEAPVEVKRLIAADMQPAKVAIREREDGSLEAWDRFAEKWYPATPSFWFRRYATGGLHLSGRSRSREDLYRENL
jgi:hypothetical protein